MKIAITGKMCYGKTTVANLIKSMIDEYEIFSFGKKVKEIAKDLFNMQTKDRTLLTSIGTKMREIDPDVWINYTINQCLQKEYCIIEDLRYQNELEACLKNDFVIIELTLPLEVQMERIKKVYPENYQDHYNNMYHVSEQGGLKIGLDISSKNYLQIDMTQDLEVVRNILVKYFQSLLNPKLSLDLHPFT